MITDHIWIESKNCKLFTTIYPKVDSETVILLHGGPGVPMDDSPIAERLIQRYQIITFEQRGTGRSPASGAVFSIEEYLEDITAVARYFGVEKFHLFGHSWGGLYAQIYAEKNYKHLLSMFLCSPSSGTGEIWKQTEREVMAFNKQHSGFWRWMLMGVYSLLGMLGSDSAFQSLFKQVLENYNQDFDPAFNATNEMIKHVRSAPINKTRPHILTYPLLKNSMEYPFPIMITYGKKDIYGESKQYVKARFPNARFVEIENSGHIPWRHTPEKFNELLAEFYRINSNA